MWVLPLQRYSQENRGSERGASWSMVKVAEGMSKRVTVRSPEPLTSEPQTRATQAGPKLKEVSTRRGRPSL